MSEVIPKKFPKSIIDIIENVDDLNSVIFHVYNDNKNLEIIVSKEDKDWLSSYDIKIIKGYANIFINYKNTPIHQVIYEKKINSDKKPENIDHANRNKLDNRRENLRAATLTQNAYNVERINLQSNCIGIKPCKDLWNAYISAGEFVYSGLYYTKEDAILVRDILVLKYHKEFGVLNYPDKVDFYKKCLEEPILTAVIKSTEVDNITYKYISILESIAKSRVKSIAKSRAIKKKDKEVNKAIKKEDKEVNKAIKKEARLKEYEKYKEEKIAEARQEAEYKDKIIADRIADRIADDFREINETSADIESMLASMEAQVFFHSDTSDIRICTRYEPSVLTLEEYEELDNMFK